MEAPDGQTEQLEDLLFDDRSHDRDVQRRNFALRTGLVHFRRVVLPMREVVNSLILMRRDVGLVPEKLTPHYQDVYDYVLMVT